MKTRRSASIENTGKRKVPLNEMDHWTHTSIAEEKWRPREFLSEEIVDIHTDGGISALANYRIVQQIRFSRSISGRWPFLSRDFCDDILPDDSFTVTRGIPFDRLASSSSLLEAAWEVIGGDMVINGPPTPRRRSSRRRLTSLSVSAVVWFGMGGSDGGTFNGGNSISDGLIPDVFSPVVVVLTDSSIVVSSAAPLFISSFFSAITGGWTPCLVMLSSRSSWLRSFAFRTSRKFSFSFFARSRSRIDTRRMELLRFNDEPLPYGDETLERDSYNALGREDIAFGTELGSSCQCVLIKLLVSVLTGTGTAMMAVWRSRMYCSRTSIIWLRRSGSSHRSRAERPLDSFS